MDSEDRLAYAILESARVVHSALGPGFVESIYGRGLTVELKGNGFEGTRESHQDLVRIVLCRQTSIGSYRKPGCDHRAESQSEHHSSACCSGTLLFARYGLSIWPGSEFRHDRVAVGNGSGRSESGRYRQVKIKNPR